MSADLPNIPLEICREILLRSPAESLFRFRAVCKQWRTVIDDPHFVRAHTSSHTTLYLRNKLGPPFEPLHTFDIDAVNFFTLRAQSISATCLDLNRDESSLLRRLPVPACNGLLLVHPEKIDDDPLEIWNPSTHERLQLPRVDYYPSGQVVFGLGYDHAAQDYKAVAMDCRRIHIYSLKSDTWRTIRHCLCSHDLYVEERRGVFVHGAVHWLLDDNFNIIALDLATEKHRQIQVNVLPETESVLRKYIDVLGGCLAVSGETDSRFNVWVMKDYGSDDELWVKLLSVSRVGLTKFLRPPFRPVAYMDSDKKQVFMKDGGSGLFMLDIKNDSMTRVRLGGLTGKTYAQIIPQSMFRLRDNCGGGNGITRRRIKPLYQPEKRKLSMAKNNYPPDKKYKKSS